MKLHDVLRHGIIIAHDSEIDVLITANGAQYRVWGGNQDGDYVNTEMYPVNRPTGLHGMDVAKLIEEGLNIINNVKTDFYEGMPRINGEDQWD